MTAYTVLLCGGMGFLLGIGYEIGRLLRTLLCPPKGAVFLLDVAYGVAAAPLTMLFLLPVTNGRPRAAAFVGLAVGFFACRATVGRLVTPTLCRLRRHTAKIRKLFLKKGLQPDDDI